jgi:hypothetical protein
MVALAQMSVVLVTPGRYDSIRKTMEHLLVQTVMDQLEIVIVAPSVANLNFDAGTSGFRVGNCARHSSSW